MLPKTWVLKYLKSNFERIFGVTKTFGHLEFIGSLPQEGHKHHHTGRASGLIEPLDSRVFEHLKHAIQTGMHFWFCFLICYCLLTFFSWLISLVVLTFNLSELTHKGSVWSTCNYNIQISWRCQPIKIKEYQWKIRPWN